MTRGAQRSRQEAEEFRGTGDGPINVDRNTHAGSFSHFRAAAQHAVRVHQYKLARVVRVATI